MMDSLLQLIPGEQSDVAHNLNREKNITKNIQNVRREFIGKPEVCHALVELIIRLRRNQRPEKNFNKFHTMWMQYRDVLLKEYDSRWLLSVVDTYADHGDNLEAAVAMNIDQCINSINIHYALLDNAVDGRLDRGKMAQERKIPTVDGMISIDIPHDDTVYNQMVRLDQVISTVPHLAEIWQELKNRHRDNPRVIMNHICGASNFQHQKKYFQ